jgi:uncharacterized surface anchored protein
MYFCRQTDCSGGVRVSAVSTVGTALPGAIFSLYSGGQPVGTAVGDSNGIAAFQNLCPGVYTVTQIAAPAGYYLSSPTPAITVSNDQITQMIAVYAPIQP